jgi:hypothetical protein
MKSYKNKILIAVGLLTLLAACKKTETFPVQNVGAQYIFDPRDSAGTNAQKYLFGIYYIVHNGHNRVGGDYLDAAGDDAVSSATGDQVTILSTGGYSSISLPTGEDLWTVTTTIGLNNVPFSYTSEWSGISYANNFIANIPVVPVMGSTNGVPNRYVWQSEARFLRAYFYFELVKRFGGVPLLGNKVYTVNNNLLFARSSFSDCINYIVNECNAIKDSLLTAPLANPDQDGYRATKGAALALKAHVLLYAASPLFNDPSGSNTNPLLGYTNYSVTRWQQAAAAAADVINLNGYKLDPVYKSVFLNQASPEIIFKRTNDDGTNIEANNGPIGFPTAVGAGITSPTQDLVNAYPMNNGKAITDPTSGYDPNNPYTNRDPRLAYNVLYNGSPWLNTTVQTFEGGVSKPNSGVQQTLTGYYMHKFMGYDETGTVFTNHLEDWIVFRYAEILLDYAEAQNEVSGPLSVATGGQYTPYAVLDSLRSRVGIPAGTDGTFGLGAGMSQTQMRTAIQNERRIEMAFEEQRYFDIRRWKIAPTVMNQPRMGVSINNSGGILTYNYVPVLITKFTAPKMYFYPIPYAEVLKNPNMKQNPGW